MQQHRTITQILILTALLGAMFVVCGVSASAAWAATLRLTPSTGVYTAGSTFSVRAVVNTGGQSINAAQGSLVFDTSALSVVSISRNSSIFNMWITEPQYSNSKGTISFSGGSPRGYQGSAGTVLRITFRARDTGSANVRFTKGSVLANDGHGTNILESMHGGAYTISAPSAVPQPEYIAAPDTPGAPTITSSSHPEADGWYATSTAHVSWKLPRNITAVRTLLDQHPGTIPTVVYTDPISHLTIPDLPEGVSYLHVQFKNSNGWGRVAHYRLGVDTERPTAFTITQSEDQDVTSPIQTLHFNAEDASSAITHFSIIIDGESPIEFIDTNVSGTYTMPSLDPGEHTVVVTAYDQAGNSIVATYSFTIKAFDKPVFTEYPTRVSSDVIPVIRGETKPGAEVTITLAHDGAEPETYSIKSDKGGEFTFIPEATFESGVYTLTARSRDASGAVSDVSDPISIIVTAPGYVQVGSFVISVLSIIVPVIALLALLAFLLWYLWYRFIIWRKRLRKETTEAEAALATAFGNMTETLKAQVADLKRSRKGKLTKAEQELVSSMEETIAEARATITKEVGDIGDIVE